MATQFEIECAVMAGAAYFDNRNAVNRTIIDTDKKGRIQIVSADGTRTYDTTVFTKNKDNPNEYLSPDEQVKLVKNGTGYQLQAGGGTLTLDDLTEDQLGGFGIHLRDFADKMGEVAPTNTINGDQNDEKKDSLAGEAGGDLIDGKSDDDLLAGLAGNDNLFGGAGIARTAYIERFGYYRLSTSMSDAWTIRASSGLAKVSRGGTPSNETWRRAA